MQLERIGIFLAEYPCNPWNLSVGLGALRGVECKYSTASTAIHEWRSWWREEGREREEGKALAANEPELFVSHAT